MALDVIVNIGLQQVSGTVGFGMPLFVAATVKTLGEAKGAVPYTVCSTLDDVVAAGFKTTSKTYEAIALMLRQENRPKQFAVYGATASALYGTDNWKDKDWRQLITIGLGNDTIENVARFVENLEGKMYFVSQNITVAEGSSFAATWRAAMSGLKTYDRTVVMYYDDSVGCPEAALVGATAGRAVGSFTYKNLILKGVPALELSDSQIATINGTDDTGHALTVVKKAGDIVTTEGMVASGEYIDIIDSKDWIIQNIAYDTQKVLNNNPKVPYTNPGIAQLESATLSVLKTAFRNGMIAPTEENENEGNYETDFARKADMAKSKIAGRIYDGGKFSFELAGAIHEAEINGTIVI